MNRKGEKIGWAGGWPGGFIWVVVLSVVFLVQGQWLTGLLGLFLAGMAVWAILTFAPWRHPATPYWKLMLGPYGMFLLSIIWAVWAYGGIQAMGLTWWNMLWLIPMLIPLGTLCQRTWYDGESNQNVDQGDASK